MDSLTHTLLGVTMANAGLRRLYGPGTALTMAVASNAPDIDALLMPLGEMAFLWRRTLTHSVFGLPLLCAGLAFAFVWIYRRLGWPAHWHDQFVLCLIAGVVHVFADLWNSYGVVLLWPLSNHRFELGWVFIIDLAVWACLILPLVIGLASRKGVVMRRASQIGLAALAVYVGLCAGGRLISSAMLGERILTHHKGTDFAYVFPEPFGPHRFRGVVRVGHEYTLYLIHTPSGRMTERGSIATDSDHPQIQSIRQTPNGQRLDWFFKAPVWSLVDGGERETTAENVEEESVVAQVSDLRFRSLVLERGTPFTFRLNAEGQLMP